MHWRNRPGTSPLMAAQRPTSTLSDNKHRHKHKHRHKQIRAPFLCACSTHPIGSATPGISRVSNSTNTNAHVAAKSKRGGMSISVICVTPFAKRQWARRWSVSLNLVVLPRMKSQFDGCVRRDVTWNDGNPCFSCTGRGKAPRW